MRVGDDVVDLDDPFIARTHERPRWLGRVLAESELAALRASRDPKTLLWSFFAAKEAAYKIAAKCRNPPPFAHRQFVVAPELRQIRYGKIVFDLVVEVEGACVHAVASTGVGARVAGIGIVEEGRDSGEVARRRLCQDVARHLRCAENTLGVVRTPSPERWDGFSPPILERDGRPSGVDISLTHDGRFVGFAAGVRKSD